jgi:23S rRNA (cytidine1920-2'-O)/16S rRNA (cytidine1409-2'-O)-methyltransferase
MTAASAKQRIDLLLVERGLVENRHKAQALVLAGSVLVGGQKIEKPGQRVDPASPIRLLGGARYASRAGAKLEAALEQFAISPEGRACADLGASTGGFTDCLLQHGARSVAAYDVGRGQLAWKLQSDPRVAVHDGTNVRNLAAEDLPQDVSLVAIDLSFISLTLVLAPLRRALAARVRHPVDVVALVKPQFEVGKGEVGKGGIVRDPEKRERALQAVVEHARGVGFTVVGTMPSPVAGAAGNREFLLYARLDPEI